MSNRIKISDYSPICMTNPYIARTVFGVISDMEPSENEVVVDFNGMVSMTFQCLNCIFGELLHQIGVDKFEKNIRFENISDGLESMLLMVIEENEKRLC